MTRSTFVAAAAIAAVLAAPPARAQSPAPRPTPAIPDTPAGRALRTWLEAFNAADSARLDAYSRQFDPETRAPDELRFRERTGGFDVLSIERSEPRHLEFTVRERARPMVGYGVIEVSDDVTPRVTQRELMGMGLDATVDAMRIDAAARARAIAGAIAQLDSFYVFPEMAKRMGDSLRARLRRGAYDAEGSGLGFVMRLTRELQAISRDKHLRVGYRVQPMPPQPATPAPPSPTDVARQREFVEEINCAFEKVERLPGNVGYLKFDGFMDVELCARTVDAAMTFVAGTRALIVDLRENGGGSPAMVSYVSSYLFDRRTHLNDLWTRSTGRTEEFWTRDSVPGRRFGGTKPVYVLTSSRTFSGAEEFTYNLKNLRRATIVGETTGGGAHPVRGRRIDEHFIIGVPFARAVNPITKTNWEGTGVEPDVKVPASEAQATAERLIRERPTP